MGTVKMEEGTLIIQVPWTVSSSDLGFEYVLRFSQEGSYEIKIDGCKLATIQPLCG